MCFFILSLVVAFCVSDSVGAVSSKPVAVIAQVNGTATIIRSKDAKMQPLFLFSELFENDKIKVKEKCRVRIVFYGDSHSVLLDGPCLIKVLSGSCTIEEGARNCINTSSSYKGIDTLIPISDSIRKVSGRFSRKPHEVIIVSPAGKCTDARPAFSWKPMEGVKEYKIRLESDSKLIREFTANGTSFQYPETEPPLNPGTLYFYSINACRNNENIAQGLKCFEIISGELSEQYNKLNGQIDEQLKKNPGDMSPYAVLLTFALENEMYDKALEVCFKLLQNNADEKGIHYMMGIIYQAKNLEDESKAEFKKSGMEPPK